VRFSLTLLPFIVLVAFGAHGQEMPTTNGYCSVSASGVMGCEWLSTPPIRWPNGETSEVSPKGVFVTRFSLAPGAPLHRMNEGKDILIVGMSDGELINEAKASTSHLDIRTGFVILMPKEEAYLLRNVGEKNLDLLVIGGFTN
jgi:hypothetical protein